MRRLLSAAILLTLAQGVPVAGMADEPIIDTDVIRVTPDTKQNLDVKPNPSDEPDLNSKPTPNKKPSPVLQLKQGDENAAGFTSPNLDNLKIPHYAKAASMTAKSMALNNEGVRALNKNDFKTAADKFLAALSSNPGYTIALNNLAVTLNNLGLHLAKTDPSRALRCFHWSYYLNPEANTKNNVDGVVRLLGGSLKDFHNREKLAEEAEKNGDEISAVIEFEAACEIQESAELRTKSGDILVKRADYAAALRQYDIAAREKPSDALNEKILKLQELTAGAKQSPVVDALSGTSPLNVLSMKLATYYDGTRNNTSKASRVSFYISDKGCNFDSVYNSCGDKAVDEASTAAVKKVGSTVTNTKSIYFLAVVEPGSNDIKVIYMPQPNFTPVMQRVQSEIKKSWHPVEESHTTRATILFTMLKDGSVKNMHFRKPTNDPAFDASAFAAVKSAHLPPLPKDSQDSVEIEFAFDYKVTHHGPKTASTNDRPANPQPAKPTQSKTASPKAAAAKKASPKTTPSQPKIVKAGAAND